jgi:hypothetical protein
MVSSAVSLMPAAFDAAVCALAQPLPDSSASAVDSRPTVIRDAVNFVTSRIVGSLVEAVSASWRYCVGGFNLL